MGIDGSPPALDARRWVCDRVVKRAKRWGMCLSIEADEGGPCTEEIEDEDDVLDSGGRLGDGVVGNGYSYNALDEVRNGVPMSGLNDLFGISMDRGVGGSSRVMSGVDAPSELAESS